MPTRSQELHAAWRAANERVREAEKRLAGAWSAYSRGDGPPPAAELLEQIESLRHECTEHLDAVLSHLARAAKGERSSGPTKDHPGS